MFVRCRKSLVKPALLGWACVVVSALPLSAFADSADEIIRKVEHNLNGKTAVMNLTMVVKTKRANGNDNDSPCGVPACLSWFLSPSQRFHE